MALVRPVCGPAFFVVSEASGPSVVAPGVPTAPSTGSPPFASADMRSRSMPPGGRCVARDASGRKGWEAPSVL
eukprot:882099-Prymnesium_polylepis.1